VRSLLVLLVLARSASADSDDEWRDHPARIEWSTWFRLGVGVESKPEATVAARTTTMPPPVAGTDTRWETGLGLDASLIVTQHARLGAWAELRGLQGFAGGELVLTAVPSSIDMFLYRGEGVLVARGGAGPQHQLTASLAYGYRCPWKLWGPYDGTSRYEIGARFVISATRSPSEWSTTVGLEFEPVGAIRYLLGIRSWY
jgi:hypothetical protein